MKSTLHILPFSFLMMLFSCGQPSEKRNVEVVTIDTVQVTIDKDENNRLEKRKQIEEQALADSIRLDKILNDALKIANENFSHETFVKKYNVATNGIDVSVEINLDYHFTKARPHLIIRRNDPNAICIDIYSKSDHKFDKVVSHKEWTMTYVNDTIRDINGDRLNDFVLNWYGSNGCCLKAFSDVYLLREDKNTFSSSFEFINPTFSPNEKIIRGICYGHPGETHMYKYKWNKEKVDTLEYVSYEKNENGKTGKILITADQSSYDDKILRVLKSVPSEYRKIEGYDWFTGIGYE